MANVFDSPRLTLKRAKHHIDDFNTAVFNFRVGSPWKEIVDKDSKAGYEVHKVVFTRELPEELPCILFDAANNLRAVLDQCGFAAAEAAGMPSRKAIKFPFAPTAAQFANAVKGSCKDLPPEIRALFEGYTAYEAANPNLWALNEVANTKKHFALIPLVLSEPRVHFLADLPPGSTIGISVNPDGSFRGWNPDKRELTMVTVPAGTDPKIRGHLNFEIAIENIRAISLKPAVRVLYDMLGIVERILMDTEAECRRVGFIR